MSVSKDRLKAILKKINDLQSSDAEVKFDAKDIKALGEIFDPNSTGLDFDGVLTSYYYQREVLKEKKKVYDDVRLYETSLLKQNNRDISDFAELLQTEIKKEEIDEERIAFLRKKIKELKKINKNIAAKNYGMEKGAVIADSLLQSTMGLTKAWGANDASGASGILGSVKGFAKGLNEAITVTNLVTTMITKMIEMAYATQENRAKLASKTGYGASSRFVAQFDQLKNNLVGLYGAVGGSEEAAAIQGDLITSVSNFQRYAKEGTFSDMGTIAGQLKRWNVSTTALGKMFVHHRENLNLTHEESTNLIGSFVTLSDNLGRPYEETYRGYASSIPILSRYGAEFPLVFRKMATAAKYTNSSIEELLSFTESVDSYKGAAKAAGKFNAALGGRFLDPVKLLAAEGGDKIKVIQEAMQMANVALGDLHPRVVRMMSKSFGVSADQLTRYTTMDTTKYSADLAAEVSPPSANTFKKALATTLTAKEHFKNEMAKIVSTWNNAFKTWLPKTSTIIRWIADHGAKVVIGVVSALAVFKTAKWVIGSFMRPKYVMGLPGSGLGGGGCGKKRRGRGNRARRNYKRNAGRQRRFQNKKLRAKRRAAHKANRGQKKAKGARRPASPKGSQTIAQRKAALAQKKAARAGKKTGLSQVDTRTARVKQGKSATTVRERVGKRVANTTQRIKSAPRNLVNAGKARIADTARGVKNVGSSLKNITKMKPTVKGAFNAGKGIVRGGGNFGGRAMGVVGAGVTLKVTADLIKQERYGEAALVAGGGAVMSYAPIAIPALGPLAAAIGATMVVAGAIDKAGIYPDDNALSNIGSAALETVGTHHIADHASGASREYANIMASVKGLPGTGSTGPELLSLWMVRNKLMTTNGLNDGGLKLSGKTLIFPFTKGKGGPQFSQDLPDAYLKAIRNPKKNGLVMVGNRIAMVSANASVLAVAAGIAYDYLAFQAAADRGYSGEDHPGIYNLGGPQYSNSTGSPRVVNIDKYGIGGVDPLIERTVGKDLISKPAYHAKLSLNTFYKSFFEHAGYYEQYWTMYRWAKRNKSEYLKLGERNHGAIGDFTVVGQMFDQYGDMKPAFANLMGDLLHSTTYLHKKAGGNYEGKDMAAVFKNIQNPNTGKGLKAFLNWYTDYGDIENFDHSEGTKTGYDTDWEDHLEHIEDFKTIYPSAEKQYIKGARKAKKEDWPNSKYFHGDVVHTGYRGTTMNPFSKGPWHRRGIRSDDTDKGAMTAAPMSKREFQNNMDDDGILIGRLLEINDLLQEIGKPRPIIAKVGEAEIFRGEA